jgi:hypothetical protein
MASTERDRVIVAQIAGAASRHARTHPLTPAQQQAAIAELATVADGRADLLAEHAGLAIGCHEGDLDERHHLRAAQLCINAGADTSLIPRWIEEGRRRAAAAAKRHRGLNPYRGIHLPASGPQRTESPMTRPVMLHHGGPCLAHSFCVLWPGGTGRGARHAPERMRWPSPRPPARAPSRG